MRTVSRRSLVLSGVAAGLLTPLAAAASEPAASGPAAASEPASPGPATVPGPVTSRLRALEIRHGARLGVHARNLRTGRVVRYRARERFAMCSVFKTLAVSHLLRDYDHCDSFLDRVVHYTQADMVEYSPITAEHLGTGMSYRGLCRAALQYSDDTAANLILRAVGGPPGVTRFCRSLGDPYTRLDRYEPDVNTAIPGDRRDTTTPDAIARTFGRLMLGPGLSGPDRRQLVAWMTGNRTSDEQFRKGLPQGWTIADKTGSGDYGAGNDVGMAWTEDGTPLVLAVLTTKPQQDADADYPLICDVATALAGALVPR
jgi:beta-lactamase class A